MKRAVHSFPFPAYCLSKALRRRKDHEGRRKLLCVTSTKGGAARSADSIAGALHRRRTAVTSMKGPFFDIENRGFAKRCFKPLSIGVRLIPVPMLFVGARAHLNSTESPRRDGLLRRRWVHIF